MKIKVLYEDPNILVIDKPSGISVHGDGRSKKKTITDWVLKNYPKMKNVGEPMGEIERSGIVHRLDKDTSGVMLLAKNQKAHEFLKKQFVNREIKKTYVAIVDGFVKNDRGVIHKPIGRSPKDFRRWLAGRGARGELREAITEYKVLKRFSAEADDFFSSAHPSRVRAGTRSAKKNHQLPLHKFTYLEVKPKTGRTHQIRVHMKFLNHPVVCDQLYNPDSPCLKGISRLALHAKSIEFKNLKGKTIKVESPVPLLFKRVVK
ncbi:MAG TPA: RluA family pseudouridine synthase [Candidatus Paceibacterota bacterium]|jgi:23S rRNA pseudouridine1911/1915/1917 synthase|nr:RluA family pseudouridine synthase [Candidatus Paceibacterota bacterium]